MSFYVWLCWHIGNFILHAPFDYYIYVWFVVYFGAACIAVGSVILLLVPPTKKPRKKEEKKTPSSAGRRRRPNGVTNPLLEELVSRKRNGETASTLGLRGSSYVHLQRSGSMVLRDRVSSIWDSGRLDDRRIDSGKQAETSPKNRVARTVAGRDHSRAGTRGSRKSCVDGRRTTLDKSGKVSDKVAERA